MPECWGMGFASDGEGASPKKGLMHGRMSFMTLSILLSAADSFSGSTSCTMALTCQPDSGAAAQTCFAHIILK